MTGRCGLHDAIDLLSDAHDLTAKVLRHLDLFDRAEQADAVEHRDSPAGNPSATTEAGSSGGNVDPAGLSQCSTITCARCGRELHSLEQIRAALECAPGEALCEGQENHPKDAYSFALGYLTCAVGDAVRDLACHSGACHEGLS